jgi:hypothetical protein
LPLTPQLLRIRDSASRHRFSLARPTAKALGWPQDGVHATHRHRPVGMELLFARQLAGSRHNTSTPTSHIASTTSGRT